MISGKIKIEATVISLNLDYSGYHKNRIQLLFYYTLFYGKFTKTVVLNASRFYFKRQGQTRQAASSLETIQVLALFTQRCITHAHGVR